VTTVLVIDDQPDIRLLACTILRTEGWEAEEAPDGTTGLARLREDGAPRVVLLDLWMPAPDGLAVLDTIRSEGLPVKVVMLSAHSDRASATEAMDRGADAFVVKPFHTEDLMDTLRQVIADDA
jgi:two-component system response regulator RegX3